MDLEYLIEIFQEKAEKLQGRDFFIETGLFLQATSKLLKLKVQTIFLEPNRSRDVDWKKEAKRVYEEIKKGSF